MANKTLSIEEMEALELEEMTASSPVSLASDTAAVSAPTPRRSLTPEEMDAMELESQVAAPTADFGIPDVDLTDPAISQSTRPPGEQPQLPPIPELAPAFGPVGAVVEGAIRPAVESQKWVTKNLGPVAASMGAYSALAPAAAGVTAALPATLVAGLAFAGANWAAKKILGTKEEAAAATSGIPGDIAYGTLPFGLGQIGGKALALTRNAAPLPYQVAGSVLGFVNSEMLRRSGKELISGEEQPPMSGLDLSLATGMGMLTELGLAGAGKMLIANTAPEFQMLANQTGKSVSQLLYEQAGTFRDSVYRFFAGSDAGKRIMKEYLKPEQRRVVQEFFEAAGVLPGTAPNFSNFIDALKKPILEKAGTAKTQIQQITQEAIDKYLPKELRPAFVQDIVDMMAMSNKITGMEKGRLLLQDSLRAIGKTPGEIQEVFQKGVVAGSADDAFVQSLKNLKNPEQASIAAAEKTASILAPVLKRAGDGYDLALGTITKDAGTIPLREGDFLKTARAMKNEISEALQSFRFTMEPTAKIVQEVIETVDGKEIIKKVGGKTVTERAPGKAITIGQATAAVRGLNRLIRASGRNPTVEGSLRKLKSALLQDIPGTLTQAGQKELADQYLMVNQEYAKAMSRAAPFNDLLDNVMPGWEKGIVLEKFDRNPQEFHSWFKKKDVGEVNLALSALEDDAAANAIRQSMKEADIRAAFEAASLGQNFDPKAFRSVLQGSKNLSFDDKRRISLSSGDGAFEPSLKPKRLTDDLIAGDEAMWTTARNKAPDLGMTPQQMEATIAKQEFFDKATSPTGGFNLTKFLGLVEQNPKLAKETGIQSVADALRNNHSLAGKTIERQDLLKFAKAFDRPTDMGTLMSLVFQNEKDVSPQRFQMLWGALPKDVQNTFKSEALNWFVHQGGPEVDIVTAMKRLQRFFSTTAREGVNPEIFKIAVGGDDMYKKMTPFMKALEHLDRANLPAKESILQIATDKAGQFTPGTTKSLPSIAKAIVANAGAHVFLKALLSNQGISDLRGLTQGIYATIAKARSELGAPTKKNKEQK